MSPRPRLDHVRRPELLAAAAEVIRERGLEHVRVADVADRAGTSPPSVLYYFASKAELLKEALTSAEERFYEELEHELEAIEAAPERMLKIIYSACGEGEGGHGVSAVETAPARPPGRRPDGARPASRRRTSEDRAS